MAKTYAIADLHGRYDLLCEAIKLILADGGKDGGTIVTMGDYIDRGPQSREVIEFLMNLEANPAPGWKVVCLKGNHEAIMFETIMKPLHPEWWMTNGGRQTIYSYGHPKLKVGRYYEDVHLGVVPHDHLKWIASLPTYFEDDNRLFVHAGVPDDAAMDQQREDTLLWMLYPEGADQGWQGKHVVHGHHQFVNGPICLPHRTDLDTLAWYTGRLVVGVFDDDIPGGPVGFLTVKGAPIWRASTET